MQASVTIDSAQTVHEFTPQLDETEAQFAARIGTELARLRMPSGSD